MREKLSHFFPAEWEIIERLFSVLDFSFLRITFREFFKEAGRGFEKFPERELWMEKAAFCCNKDFITIDT